LKKAEFIDSYARFLSNGSAGLFIGAGVSMQAGYPSWRQLVRDMAEDIGLDASKEDDLAGVVQYFLNKAGKTRTRLARIITEHFGEEKPIPPVFHILSRLPLTRLWTTNYDTLLERAYRERRKQLDVKSRDKDVTSENPFAHALLYKMHGTVEHPSEVVIAKSDYESYRKKRPGFLQLLMGHLISRHILFVGLSFTDPNLSYLFTLIRESFDDTPPEHFAIVRQPHRGDYDADASFEYAQRRHGLWVDDLQNYGLQCVEIEDYAEIDTLLEAVERRIAMGSVMVSGSFPDPSDDKRLAERARIEAIASAAGTAIAKHNFRLVSGMGTIVGNASLSAALAQINTQATPNFERSLFLRPFPQTIPGGQERQAYYRRYREDLVTEAGVSIYIAGIKDGAAAPGVIAEFEIATGAKRYPVPIGASGGAAQEIWQRVAADYPRYLGDLPRNLFDALNDPAATPDAIGVTIERILAWLKANDPYSQTLVSEGAFMPGR
jgi:hypothetical protein